MHKQHPIIVALLFLAILLGGGSMLFHSLESWTWIESFYFTVATVATVGYGDIAPTSDTTRLVAALFIIFGVAIGAGIIRYMINAIVRSQAERRSRRNHDDTSE